MNDANPTLSLADRVVVLTGGSRGIGRALAGAIAAAGARLVVLARDAATLDQLSVALRGAGAQIETHSVDLKDTGAIKDAFAGIVDTYGHIDGLVNNAGITKVGPTIDYDVDDARNILDVNVLGLLTCSQEAARAMPGGGSIVNMASLSSFIGQPERTAYVASKAAVLGMTKSMAVEWGPSGIRVNAVAPGYIETDLSRALMAKDPEYRGLVESRTPLRRFGKPADVGGPVVFLLSDNSEFVTGAHISVDGGWLANGFMK